MKKIDKRKVLVPIKTKPKKPSHENVAQVIDDIDDEKKLVILKAMLKTELMAECRKRKLPTTGTKVELVDILMKKKKENSFKDMLKPDLIKACKEQGLPFIGTKARLLSALLSKEEEEKKEVDAAKEKMGAKGCFEDMEETPKTDQSKTFASREHDDGEREETILEEVMLLQKDPKRMGDKVDLQMMKKKRQKKT